MSVACSMTGPAQKRVLQQTSSCEVTDNQCEVDMDTGFARECVAYKRLLQNVCVPVAVRLFL